MHTSMVFTTTGGTRRRRRASFTFGKGAASAVAAVSSLSFAANGDLIIHAEVGVYVKKMCVRMCVCMPVIVVVFILVVLVVVKPH